MEVLGFSFKDKKEEELIRQFLLFFPVLEISSQIAEATIQTRKLKKIRLPDAIIYATALVNNCSLTTANDRDFRGLGEGVEVLNPMI